MLIMDLVRYYRAGINEAGTYLVNEQTYSDSPGYLYVPICMYNWWFNILRVGPGGCKLLIRLHTSFLWKVPDPHSPFSRKLQAPTPSLLPRPCVCVLKVISFLHLSLRLNEDEKVDGHRKQQKSLARNVMYSVRYNFCNLHLQHFTLWAEFVPVSAKKCST